MEQPVYELDLTNSSYVKYGVVWKLDYGLGMWWMCSAAYSCPHINVYDKCTK